LGSYSHEVTIETRGVTLAWIGIHRRASVHPENPDRYFLEVVLNTYRDVDRIACRVDSLDIDVLMEAFQTILNKAEECILCSECSEKTSDHIDNMCIECFSKQATSAYYSTTKSKF